MFVKFTLRTGKKKKILIGKVKEGAIFVDELKAKLSRMQIERDTKQQIVVMARH